MDQSNVELQQELERKAQEHETAMKRLAEAESKMKQYQEATEKAYEEVGQMQNKLQNEQRCLETAVQVASKLYSRNTELKRMSMRQRTFALSQRREAWKTRHSKKEGLEVSIKSSMTENGSEEPKGDSIDSEKDLEDVECVEDESPEDLEALAGLDKKSKSDLENALEEVNHLRKLNNDLQEKLARTGDDEKENQTITQLQAVIRMKDDELNTLKQKYNVESEVRLRAETYAARMYGKHKASQRKSVLIKSASNGNFEDKLMETMKDLEKITGDFEQEKMKHKQEILKWEEKLEAALAGQEKTALENEISVLKVEIEQLKADKGRLEEQNASLEKQLESKTEAAPVFNAPPPPPPIAPPPPPPLPPANGDEQAKSVYAVIAERRANKQNSVDSPARTRKISTPTAVDGYADAMAEMMRRIKEGNALRKSNTLPPPPEEDDVYSNIGGDNSDESSEDEQDYDDIYNHVGLPTKKDPFPSPGTLPDIGASGKWATIGYAPRKKAVDNEATVFKWPGLKPVKPRIQSENDALEDSATSPTVGFQLRKTQGFTRGSAFQDSVKLPKGINPDLKKMLDARRQGMKKAQSVQDAN